jgi:YkoY family integral membrane protein
MFGQTFAYGDVGIIALLIVLEGVLSIDNALVLGILAKRLPKQLQKQALTYGLIGAFVFRVVAICLATYLLHWWLVKLLGGLYLLYIAAKHFIFGEKPHDEADPHLVADEATGQPGLETTTGEPLSRQDEQTELEKRLPGPLHPAGAGLSPAGMTAALAGGRPGFLGVPAGLGRKFWSTVLVIELTDIAFAIDSILAAIGTIPAHVGSGPNPKLWIVITGGIIGVILMRFAAVLFIKLLDRFPRFAEAAYLLVALIGTKLVLDWGFNKPPTPTPEGWHAPLDFHFHTAGSPASWAFWGLMLVFFCVGFIPKKPAVAAA